MSLMSVSPVSVFRSNRLMARCENTASPSDISLASGDRQSDHLLFIAHRWSLHSESHLVESSPALQQNTSRSVASTIFPVHGIDCRLVDRQVLRPSATLGNGIDGAAQAIVSRKPVQRQMMARIRV